MAEVMNKEKKAQELYMQLQMINEDAKQIYKQLQSAEGQFMEMAATIQGLEEFKKIEQGAETFVPLSTGILAKAELKDTARLLVNVGANVAVEKDIESTKKLIERQIGQLKEVRDKMAADLKRITAHGSMIEQELQKLVSE